MLGASHGCDAYEQTIPDVFSPKLRSYEQVFEEESRATESGVGIVKERVTSRLPIPIRHQRMKLRVGTKSIAGKHLNRGGGRQAFIVCHLMNQGVQHNHVTQIGRTNRKH